MTVISARKRIEKKTNTEASDKGTAKLNQMRAMQCGLTEHFTAEEWRNLRNHYNNTCLSCGKSGHVTADHVIPMTRGGENTVDNIQPLCLSCNLFKKQDVIDYRPISCIVPKLIRKKGKRQQRKPAWHRVYRDTGGTALWHMYKKIHGFYPDISPEVSADFKRSAPELRKLLTSAGPKAAKTDPWS